MKSIFILFLFICFQQFIIAGEPVTKKDSEKNIIFDEATIKLFQSIPILSEGRVKPLNTYASFLLLKLNGKRIVRESIYRDYSGEIILVRDLLADSRVIYKPESGKKIQPMEWFLTALFYPEQAMTQRIFLVENREILESFEGKNLIPRDWYSYAELEPMIQNIFKRAIPINKMDTKKRSLVEQQILDLAIKINDFSNILNALEFARPMTDTSSLGLNLNKPPRHVFAQMTEMQKRIFDNEPMKSMSEDKKTIVKEELERVSIRALELLHQADWLTIFPPNKPENKIWQSPFDLISNPSQKATELNTFAILEEFEKTCLAISTKTESSQTFQSLGNLLTQNIYKQPVAKNYLNKINIENFYYKTDFIYKSLILFIAIFLSISFSFLMPKSPHWYLVNNLLLFLPIIGLIIAITLRCIILGRPPVATLYETILFITAIICIACLFLESIYKNKIIMFVTSIVGASGLFLSYAYETSGGTDTMGNLVAVLNSNFWLSTHVTTVTIGYSAGLLASVFAHIYIGAKVFRLTEDPEFYKALNKIMYGVICFCTLFATIGTILGGIWANYSWGRFWGWDPKENGALAIVLWNLIILHGRLGGIFKEFGVAIMCIIGGMVVVASWWGVNQLGVGLHSYGFTDGIIKNLIIFTVLELFILIVGLGHHYILKLISSPKQL